MAMEIPEELRPDVKLAVFETGVLGPIGAFSSAADIASIATWWGYLLVQYSKHYGITLDKEAAKKICSTALIGMGGYYLGCKTATKLFHLIPGAGTVAAMGISALQNIIFTYRFAVTLTRIFSKGTVDFDALADSIKYMFAGTATGILSIKDIVELYFNYGASTTNNSNSSSAIQSKIKSAAQPQIKPALSSVSRNSSTSTYNVTMEGYGSGHLRVSDRYVEYIEKNLTFAYTYIQDVKRSGSQLTVYSKYNHYTIHFQDASQAAVVESKILKKI